MKTIMMLALMITASGLGAVSHTAGSGRLAGATVIRVTAKKFDFTPSAITVKKGVPVVLELTSADRTHGFNLPDFKLSAKIEPGKVARLEFTPDKAGEFSFSCDVFCGSGHEDMAGKLTVVE
jgi:cytochrome c oxidase subunit 2